MKKALLIVLISVMALEMMACGSLGFEGTYKIVTCDGEIWDYEEDGLIFFTFEDGTVTVTLEMDGKVETYIGTYILDGNELTLIYRGEETCHGIYKHGSITFYTDYYVIVANKKR